ncbi:MAG: WG repeat-containing protein [Chitinophagaceae bacterium]|nr:WG repeat-containing protein [Chitinophagaceae bacterium]
MKRLFVTLLISCISIHAISQDLIAFRNNKGLWGFKNKSGQIVVEPTYTYRPGEFSNGRSIVAQTYTLRGVIDDKGNKIVSPKYYSISDYINGFAVAVLSIRDTVNKINGNPRQVQLKGILNRNGEEVVPVMYKNLQGDFSNGWFVVGDTGSQKRFYFNVKGELFEPPAGVVLMPDNLDGNIFIAHKSYKYGLVDKNFKEILPFEYTSIRSSGHPGLLIVKKGALNGLMNYKLKWILPPTYQVISLF